VLSAFEVFYDNEQYKSTLALILLRLWRYIYHLLTATVLEIYTVFQKKTSTHIISYKLGNSCLILIIFDTKILHII